MKALAMALVAVASCGGEVEIPPPVRTEIVLGSNPYDAWQGRGATFRIVCQQPCPVPEATVVALHSGMTRGKEALVQLAGLDVLPSFAPVEVHLTADSICGPFSTGLAGFSTVGADGRAYLCLFSWEWNHPPKPYLPAPLDGEIRHQTLFVHEYSHTLFFGRHEVSWESVVRAISYQVTGTIPDPCDSRLTTNAARLVRELCLQAGFSWGHLAPSLRALDALYQTGAGQADPAANSLPAGHPPTSIYQWRKILDQQLGKQTLDAFIAGHDLPWNHLGDDVTITPGGGRFELYRGRIVLEVPPGAVAAPVEIKARYSARLGQLVPGWGDLAFASVQDLQPRTLSFAQPVTVTVTYDPALVPPGGDPGTLQLFTGPDVRSMSAIPGGAVDVVAATVRGSVNGLGYFFASPPL